MINDKTPLLTFTTLTLLLSPLLYRYRYPVFLLILKIGLGITGYLLGMTLKVHLGPYYYALTTAIPMWIPVIRNSTSVGSVSTGNSIVGLALLISVVCNGLLYRRLHSTMHNSRWSGNL